MATRARRIEEEPDDASPNTVLGRGAIEPVIFPVGSPTRVTDSEVAAGNVMLRIALTQAARTLGDMMAGDDHFLRLVESGLEDLRAGRYGEISASTP